MSYRNGVQILDQLFQQNNVTSITIKHSLSYNISSPRLASRLLFPGYKFRNNNAPQDYVVEFEYNNIPYRISHADIALDIYQKVKDNPQIANAILDLIFNIGITGAETEIPVELSGMVVDRPDEATMNLLLNSVKGHRLNDLPFGIPIEDLPHILYWTSLNEEVNYSPSINPVFGGRRTCYKRYIEAVYFACLSNAKGLNPPSQEDIVGLSVLLTRIVRGRQPLLPDFPELFALHFNNIDNNYEH